MLHREPQSFDGFDHSLCMNFTSTVGLEGQHTLVLVTFLLLARVTSIQSGSNILGDVTFKMATSLAIFQFHFLSGFLQSFSSLGPLS